MRSQQRSADRPLARAPGPSGLRVRRSVVRTGDRRAEGRADDGRRGQFPAPDRPDDAENLTPLRVLGSCPSRTEATEGGRTVADGARRLASAGGVPGRRPRAVLPGGRGDAADPVGAAGVRRMPGQDRLSRLRLDDAGTVRGVGRDHRTGTAGPPATEEARRSVTSPSREGRAAVASAEPLCECAGRWTVEPKATQRSSTTPARRTVERTAVPARRTGTR